jgi:hypothetical protein
MPINVRPMLAMLVHQPFDRRGWLFEIKWDGYRAIAEVDKGQVRLYLRNGLSFTVHFGLRVTASPKCLRRVCQRRRARSRSFESEVYLCRMEIWPRQGDTRG